MRSWTLKAQPSAQILIVDDNQHGLAARKAVLKELGHHVTTASTAQDALQLFTDGNFDLVITDYKMPEMDGIELIRRIRAIQPATRIILLSGFVEPLFLNEKSTGADVVISKSAGEVTALVRSVARLMNQKSGRKPPGSAGPANQAESQTS